MFPGYRALYAYMHCPLADAQRSSVPHCPIRPPSPSPPSPPPARSPSAPVCARLHSATDMCRHAQTDRHTQISTDKHRHVRLLPSALVRSRPLSSAPVRSRPLSSAVRQTDTDTDRHRHRHRHRLPSTPVQLTHSRPKLRSCSALRSIFARRSLSMSASCSSAWDEELLLGALLGLS